MQIINSIGLHLFMVALIVILAGLIIINRNNISKNETKWAKIFGYTILTVWILYNIYNFLPTNFKIGESLPLHVCDVLAGVSIIALLSQNRKARTVLYFCALPLTSQAIMTPTGEQNPLLIRFWLFWCLHAGIILASIYEICIRKYSPTFKSFLFVVLCDILYIIIILPIDVVFNFNYGFIGNSSPDTATMVDIFGPWPIRILWMLSAVVLVQFLMYVPWRLKKSDNLS